MSGAPAHTTPRPPDDPAAFEAWNAAMVAKYDNELFHRNPSRLIRYVETRRVRKVIELLECRRTDHVLEVGCGAGFLLSEVPSDQRSGVDLSEELLAKARARLGPAVSLQKANAEELPFEACRFDRVFCSEVLEHVLHPDQVVSEIVRVTKPDGRIVLTIPVDKTILRVKKTLRALGLYGLLLGRAKKGEYQPPEDNDWHLHNFDLAKLRGITAGRLTEVHLAALPNRLFPVHYVLAYTPNARSH
jgi:SAM-dependent methyltransferase